MKDVILDTAIAHFGMNGYAGAATRAIAQEADTAMSSITYHFGGKEGLYLACADHIAARVAERFDPILTRIESAPSPDRQEAQDRICDLLAIFAQLMLDPASEHWSYFIVREQHTPTEAFGRLWTGAIRRVIDNVLVLIHAARPDFSDADARACAIALWGQAMILRTARASVCRVMQTDELDPATGDVLIDRLIANTRCVLSAEPENA